MNLPELFEEHRSTLLIGLMGLFLLGVGVLSAVVLSRGNTSQDVEIIRTNESDEKDDYVFVDVEGAVQTPGVYRLEGDVRVADVLQMAGGVSDDADQNWVSKYINLAQKVSDGVKIYIPFLGEQMNQQEQQTQSNQDQSDVLGLDASAKMNINTATISDLDTLWGIGEKRAQDIIDHRPYESVEQLREKNVIPANIYDRIKHELSVF